MFLFESLEDLGAVQQGDLCGQRPASMWQWPTFFELLERQGWEQLLFIGLLKDFQFQQQPAFVQGRPRFDEQGFYEGPLTKREAVKQLIGHTGNSFATKGTEQWPSGLCRWIAQENFHTSVVLASGGFSKIPPQPRKTYNYRARRLESTRRKL